MGINQLLPHMKSVKRCKNLKNLPYQTVGIDGHSWMHKTILGCGSELIYSQDISKMVKRFLDKLNSLVRLGRFFLISYSSFHFLCMLNKC